MKKIKCPRCDGNGETQYEYNGATHYAICLKCSGEGKIIKKNYGKEKNKKEKRK